MPGGHIRCLPSPEGLKIQGRQYPVLRGKKQQLPGGLNPKAVQQPIPLHSQGKEAKMKESIDKKDLVKADTVHRGSSGRTKAKHREKDLKSTNKSFLHTRQLIAAVRKGQGYFYLLKREEDEKTKAFVAEKQRPELQSTSQKDVRDEEAVLMDSSQTSFFWTDYSLKKKPEKKEKMTARPFTPVYNSLLANRLAEADPTTLFRQLCALHWLLEALNGEPSNTLAMTPVSNCWNTREPGGYRTPLKQVNNEKAVEYRWKLLVTPGKSKKVVQKSVLSRRKPSIMSISRFSALSSNHTPTLGSMSSLPHSSEDCGGMIVPSSECYRDGEESDSMASSSQILPKTSREDDNAVSDYLRKLREMIQAHVTRDLATDRRFQNFRQTWTAPVIQNQDKILSSANNETEKLKIEAQKCTGSTQSGDSGTSHFIKGKLSMCQEMRQKFSEIADEAASCLNKKVKAMEGRRQVFSAEKFNSLRTVSHFQKDLSRMRRPLHCVRENFRNSTNWFFSLFSRIPDDMKKIPKIQKILGKLENFGEMQDEGVRPSVFLKVLEGLRTWELCSPDLCVAIEFVRENLVRMSENEYAAWLRSRVAISSRPQTAPPMR